MGSALVVPEQAVGAEEGAEGQRVLCLSRVGENGIRNGKMFHVSRQSGRQAGSIERDYF